ncbi:hypothetical protein ACFLYD_04495 [Chloroflexota bacterium]
MSLPTDSENWSDAISAIICSIPQGAVVSLLGVIVVLLGAIDAELFGIQADAILDEWRIVFGVAGAILFFVGIWLILSEKKENGPKPPGEDEPVEGAAPCSLVRQAPAGNRKTITVSTPLGEMHRDGIDVLGSVGPGIPNAGVWLVNQRVRRTRRRGAASVVERMNRIFPYKATVGPTGDWSRRVPFVMWENDEEVEFCVWAMVPTRDVQALFEHHWANRDKFAETQDTVERARAQGSEIDWKRPWVPLPEDYLPSSLCETEKFTVVLVRV